MSNPIENFLKSIRSQGQPTPSQPAQARPAIDTTPTPPPQPQTQPLPPVIPPSQAIVENMVMELSRLSTIERAIVAMALGFEEPLKNVSPEEWAKLLDERVGRIYGDAFRKWVKTKFGGGDQQ